MLIGLTGQIGAGKTSAASVLARLGAAVVDADRIGHQVVDQSIQLRKKLVNTFGAEIVNAGGNIIRKKLAKLAFENQESKDKLNSLVHPYLLKELRSQVLDASRTHSVVVLDAALLLYWGMDKEVDFVLVIHAGRESRLGRLAARGISKDDALARQKSQLPYREFRKRADRVMLNNGSPEDLARKVKQLFAHIAPQTN